MCRCIPLILLFLSAAPLSAQPVAAPDAGDRAELKAVRANDVELHYVEQGEGAPVVLIHGSLADYTYWDLSDQLALLSGGHRVVAYSRRYNHPNRNPRGDDHSPMVEARDLGALLDALDTGPVHLVGHSYGAYTALVYALEHPERVRSLVLAEPPIISWLPDIPGGEGIFERFMAGVWGPLGERFHQGTHEGLDFTAQWYFGVPWEEVEPEWQTLFANNAEEWRALAVSKHTYPKLDYDRVRALSVPTLLLSGGDSRGFNPLIDGHLERLLPNVERVFIPDASHEMFLDNRQASARRMLAFFGRNVGGAAPVDDHAAPSAAFASGRDVVQVAPPTGERGADRASILAAFAQVASGGTVQFGAGRYLVGPIIRIDTPGISLQGHPDGTVLRGCELDEYEAMEVEWLEAFRQNGFTADNVPILGRCGHLHLTGGNVTVRGFTFEQSRMGVVLGCCESEQVLRSLAGGYLIEDNVFRNSGNSIRAWLQSEEPTIIRGNQFFNTFHALSAMASRIHFVDNRVSVPEPGLVPYETHPGFGVTIGAYPAGAEAGLMPPMEPCIENLISGNHIEGHPDALVLIAAPGTVCRDNVVQDNTLIATRVPRPEVWRFEEIWPISDPDDPTFVGLPLRLWGDDGGALPPEFTEDGLESGRVEGTRVERNRIQNADGLGIQLVNASRNRIVQNTISEINVRLPYPGNEGNAPGGWEAVNGSAIWLSPGSDENEVIGNDFADVASYGVVLAGDRNRVEVRSADDEVRDLGSDNIVLVASGSDGAPASNVQESATSAEVDLAAIEVASHDWWLDGDLGRLDRLMMDEFRFIAMNGALEDKLEIVHGAARSGDPAPRVLQVESLRVEPEEVIVRGNEAIVVSLMHIHATVRGRPIPERMKVMSVFLMEGGEWRLFARSITPILAPPPQGPPE